MSAPTDVLAALREIADGEGDTELLAMRVHAAVSELIEADDLYTKVRELWDHGSLSFIVYKGACDRRELALDRVRPEQPTSHGAGVSE